jgi:hypothetical protein
MGQPFLDLINLPFTITRTMIYLDNNATTRGVGQAFLPVARQPKIHFNETTDRQECLSY